MKHKTLSQQMKGITNKMSKTVGDVLNKTTKSKANAYKNWYRNEIRTSGMKLSRPELKYIQSKTFHNNPKTPAIYVYSKQPYLIEGNYKDLTSKGWQIIFLPEFLATTKREKLLDTLKRFRQRGYTFAIGNVLFCVLNNSTRSLFRKSIIGGYRRQIKTKGRMSKELNALHRTRADKTIQDIQNADRVQNTQYIFPIAYIKKETHRRSKLKIGQLARKMRKDYTITITDKITKEINNAK